MSSDIRPLTSIVPAPPVREKRHHASDQKQQKKHTIDEIEPDSDVESDESDAARKNNVDEKNAGVKHIDEYA